MQFFRLHILMQGPMMRFDKIMWIRRLLGPIYHVLWAIDYRPGRDKSLPTHIRNILSKTIVTSWSAIETPRGREMPVGV